MAKSVKSAKKKPAHRNKPGAKKKPAHEPDYIEATTKAEEDTLKRRADFEHNQALIYAAFLNIATEKQKWPTIKEVSEQTKLSFKTVQRHMEESRASFDKVKDKYSIFSEAAMFRLATKAASGTSKDWTELFFKVMHGIGDRKQMDITSGGKPIQPAQQITQFDLSKLQPEQIKFVLELKKKIAIEDKAKK